MILFDDEGVGFRPLFLFLIFFLVGTYCVFYTFLKQQCLALFDDEGVGFRPFIIILLFLFLLMVFRPAGFLSHYLSGPSPYV